MDIAFDTSRLEKEFNDQRLLGRVYGFENTKLIRQRLDDLEAVANLAELPFVPK